MRCDKTLHDLHGIDFPYQAQRDICPVDYCLHLLQSLQVTVCGKGVFCRDGGAQLEKIIREITTGNGKSGDIPLIRELCNAMEQLADCDLTKSIVRQISDLVQAESETWESHIARHRCPTLKCGRLALYYIDPALCNGCGQCVDVCKDRAIDGGKDLIHVISRPLCSRCGKCESVCPVGAIKRADVAGIMPKTPSSPVPVGSFKAVVPGQGLRKGLRK